MKRIIAVLVCILAMCICACAMADVPINETIFPDAIFRAYVEEKFDADHDNKLIDVEIEAAIVIDVEATLITDLTGIEYFTLLLNSGVDAMG